MDSRRHLLWLCQKRMHQRSTRLNQWIVATSNRALVNVHLQVCEDSCEFHCLMHFLHLSHGKTTKNADSSFQVFVGNYGINIVDTSVSIGSEGVRGFRTIWWVVSGGILSVERILEYCWLIIAHIGAYLVLEFMGTLGSHDDQDAFCQHDFLWLGFDKNPYNHQLLQRPPKTSRVDPGRCPLVLVSCGSRGRLTVAKVGWSEHQSCIGFKPFGIFG